MASSILVVDDNPKVRKAMRALFTDEGHEVLEATDGQEALDTINRFAGIEVVVADIRMPVMNGITLLERIVNRYPHISVIMLTAKGTVDTAIDCMRRGAANYLIKPVEPSRILECVYEVLDSRRQNQARRNKIGRLLSEVRALALPPEVTENTPFEFAGAVYPVSSQQLYTFGGILVDYRKMTASYHGERVDLTEREMEILVCLIKANGDVVSLVDIAQSILYEKITEEKAQTMFSTHIGNLRAKLRSVGCPEYIKNRRGFGYYLDGDPLRT